ncbi:MAG: hypothetical protein MRZ79_14820 [Bacteroidia bacterium]|nr:hypothetical protein [Bacteroidia bacterium]
MSEILTQTKLATVNQLNCTGCGNALSIINPRAKYICCQYCGSVLDLNSEEHQILETIGKPEKHKPFSFLELGMIGKINGKTYQLIARTRWRTKHKEFWYEEGQSGYSNEHWIYDEWLMIDENRTYFYLIEDKDGYFVSEEIIPETPMLLDNSLKMQFFRGEAQKRVQEYGSAEVVFFEGESNYTIKKGDEIRYSTYIDRGINYTSEWRMENGEEIKEIEFFQEIPVSRRKIIEWFGTNEQVTELQEDEAFWKFVYRGSLVGVLLMLVMGIASMSSKGKIIYSEDVPFAALQGDEGKLVGPFEIPKKGQYRMEMKVFDLQPNSEAYIMGYILDKDQAAINNIEGSFGYYTGYDDGYWSEKEFESKLRFRANEPGEYYVQFHSADAASQQGSLKVFLRQGGMMGRYFLIALIIFGIVAAVSKGKFE